jgi:hypothetical protein
LHPPHLPFELLVAVLQLLNHAGDLANLGFEPIDAHDQVRAGRLSEAVRSESRRLILRLALRLLGATFTDTCGR